MAFSEKRITQLSKKLAKELLASGHATAKAGESGLADLISRQMMIDHRLELEIEEEARIQLTKQRTLPPEGTSEYNAALLQAKRALAIRKGFKL